MSRRLMNSRTGCVVAFDVELATTRAERRRGLLGRDWLHPHEGIVLAPCMAVHTAFMRFPIDVVFIDSDGKAVQIVHELSPWRITASLRARAVVELASGTAAAEDIRIGDHLYLTTEPESRELAGRAC